MNTALSGLSERPKSSTFLVLPALFVDGKVEVIDEGVDLREVVLQPGGEPTVVGCTCEEPVEAELILASERPSGTIAKAVDIVELDGVEALCLAHV